LLARPRQTALFFYPTRRSRAELTYRFLKEYSVDRIDIRIDAQEAKHISAERRAQLEESYLPHEREARIHGIPQPGIARVFPFPLEASCAISMRQSGWISASDIHLRLHCAWLPDTDQFFVVDGFKMQRSEALHHVKRIAGMCRGLRIPIAWPHDGLTHEKGSGIALADVDGSVRRCWRSTPRTRAAVTTSSQRSRKWTVT
jgi:hypothetical protein